MNRRRRTSRGHPGERGQDLIEYALIAPVLFLIFFGIMDFGIAIFSYNTLANAVREGARYGVIPSNDPADVETTARALTAGLDPDALDFTLVSDCSADTQVHLEGTYDLNLITAIVIEAVGGDGAIQLSASSTMRCE